MNIRLMTIEDVPELEQIHKEFYPNLEMPDFTKFLHTFVIENDSEIILGGGIRAICEVSLLTNKDYSRRERREALYQALQASLMGAGRFNFNQVHCFVSDEIWSKQLKRVGFRSVTGETLVIG